MPPRLPCSALRSPAPPFRLPTARALSSTPAPASPPRDAPAPHARSSSSGDLLSLIHDKPRRAGRLARPVARPGETASNLLSRLERETKHRRESLEALRNEKISTDYLKQMPRRWDAGDVYSPHDLSPAEMQKWRRRSARRSDVVDALGIRPLDMYKNFSLVQEFTTSSGQIIHSSGTSLRPVNQRKIAKMIRRVQGMGIYPTIHDHPEMIRENFFPPSKTHH
ncbi:uncharacterized protein UV8b_00123 [Ustilaginoidea virens]|uniref:Small ribosomal subunit protein bS18m n=1 Tax=Ustilaginoidea virens TaxID=1159556 RepID=A0A8E5HII4_USTVR|nr:uncharacterized protein UV8b_00123 [Ustilaginoidea virens]QUC15882.1 hypothetical protein UV8b_00123 [Ustilaginoidea virens]